MGRLLHLMPWGLGPGCAFRPRSRSRHQELHGRWNIALQHRLRNYLRARSAEGLCVVHGGRGERLRGDINQAGVWRGYPWYGYGVVIPPDESLTIWETSRTRLVSGSAGARRDRPLYSAGYILYKDSSGREFIVCTGDVLSSVDAKHGDVSDHFGHVPLASSKTIGLTKKNEHRSIAEVEWRREDPIGRLKGSKDAIATRVHDESRPPCPG